jgi:hypothetical protein
MKKEDYNKNVLLDVLGSYLRQINRSNGEYNAVVLSDIKASIKHVLRINDYTGRYVEDLSK